MLKLKILVCQKRKFAEISSKRFCAIAAREIYHQHSPSFMRILTLTTYVLVDFGVE